MIDPMEEMEEYDYPDSTELGMITFPDRRVVVISVANSAFLNPAAQLEIIDGIDETYVIVDDRVIDGFLERSNMNGLVDPMVLAQRVLMVAAEFARGYLDIKDKRTWQVN